ncbi:hypothetical protein B7494_g8055 [Chlorociboria aeruginascens]|nr:hypothetical protein B7494_g8055 [Chlorociboria aeruginascens]
MGEFHDTVSVLLDAFARGIDIIKARRAQRKRPSRENEGGHPDVSKALKEHRTQVKKAYSRDQARFGPRFATGDTEARSSLSAILFRLNAGFVSIIESFARGGSSTDYQALLNLSNSSRMEAIHTFDQLAERLSQPSSTTPQIRKRHAGRSQPKAKKRSTERHRSRKTSELSFTPLGLATPEGWVRHPKQGRKLSSDSKSAVSPRRNAPPTRATLPVANRAPIPEVKPLHRKSIMSFASDSTKLGEIPERKWGRRPPVFEAEAAANFPISTFFPLAPYREPEKPRSRFMRLFKR